MKYIKYITESYDEISVKLGYKLESLPFSCIAVILYKILLDIIYVKYIATTYAFFYYEISIINIINGGLVIIMMAPLMAIYYKQNTCSSIIMIALNMIYFIPITTYCGYGGGSSSFLLFAIIYWGALSILQIKLPIIGVAVKETSSTISYKGMYILIILVSLLSLYIWFEYSGCRIQMNILDVYDIRAEAAQNAMPSVLSYARQLSTIIVPILILFTLVRKKYLMTVWLLFITLINFSYAGNKSIILFPIILIGGYIFYRKNMISLIFPFGVALEIVAIIEQKIGSVMITSLFFRRQGLVLAQLSEYYYRFFLENPTDLFRNSLLGKFGFESIYNVLLGKVIGNNFETQIVNCNNGLLADVWSGLGLIGIVVMPIIIIICFRLLDFVSYKVDMRLMVGFVLYYAIMFANTTWSTVLLTHGFLVMCIMLIIFPRENEPDRLGVSV